LVQSMVSFPMNIVIVGCSYFGELIYLGKTIMVKHDKTVKLLWCK
jgi:hypothetical protein